MTYSPYMSDIVKEILPCLYSFTVPGKPSGKARPRFVSGHVYSPDVGNFQARVAMFAQAGGVEVIEGPVQVDVFVTRRLPSSVSKRRRALLLKQEFAVGKPDGSNVLSAIHDGLMGIAYKDDQQVAVATFHRVWDEIDGTRITIRSLL